MQTVGCQSVWRIGKNRVRSQDAGIPRAMKENFEARSGLSYDDVVIHYRSDRPGRLGALAYTRGRHVYIGPGQEKSLPHELVHVAQQKQGLVRTTAWQGGLPVNDLPCLERAARQNIVERRAGTGEYPSEEALPVQFDRLPTFYTYLCTKSNNKLPTTRQGPHTIPHAYYEFLIKNYDLSEIFNYMIPTPKEMQQLIGREGIAFDRVWAEQQIQRCSNKLDESRLQEKINEWEKDFPKRLRRFRREYKETYGRFQESKESQVLMALLNMHPYATYAWCGDEPYREELAGKGEGLLISELQDSLGDHGNQLAFAVPSIWQKYIDLGVRGRKSYHSKSDFQSFIECRLWYGVRTIPQLKRLASKIAGRLDEEKSVLHCSPSPHRRAAKKCSR